VDSIIEDIVVLKKQIEQEDNITAVSEAIQKARFCVCAGTGRTGLVMKAFAQRLAQLGFKAFDIMDSNLPRVSNKDLFIAASFRGENPIILDFIDIAVKNNVNVIYITENPQDLKGVTQIQLNLKKDIVEKYFFGCIFVIALWLFLDYVVNNVGKGKIAVHTNFL
jgi:6-phospho-3-hexuloisomerase